MEKFDKKLRFDGPVLSNLNTFNLLSNGLAYFKTCDLISHSLAFFPPPTTALKGVAELAKGIEYKDPIKTG